MARVAPECVVCACEQFAVNSLPLGRTVLAASDTLPSADGPPIGGSPPDLLR